MVFNFYVSWYKAGANGLCNLHWATYEELAEDPFECVKGVLEFAGVAKTDEEIGKAVGIEQGREMASGLYLTRMVAGEYVGISKMLLIK